MSLSYLIQILQKFLIFKIKLLQIFVIQNARFAKFFFKNRGVSLLILKMFSQNFRSKTYDYHDYIDAWYYTFFFRPFDHSWFFHWGDEIKNQINFPNWFQEWWLFFGAIKDILCPKVLEGYKYFSEHDSHLVPASYSQVLYFLSKFQIPQILYWDFVLSQMIPAPFPAHLAREFKVKWWSNFSHSTTQQIPHIRQWISSKNYPLKPSSSKVSIPILLDAILLSRTSFPSDKEFKKHLKLLKKKASETLSQFSDFGFDDDTALFAFLGDVNEDMCYDLLYTPLDDDIVDFDLKRPFGKKLVWAGLKEWFQGLESILDLSVGLFLFNQRHSLKQKWTYAPSQMLPDEPNQLMVIDSTEPFQIDKEYLSKERMVQMHGNTSDKYPYVYIFRNVCLKQ